MLAGVVFCLAAATPAGQDVSVTSPDGRVTFRLSAGDRFQYVVTLANALAIETSPIGITVDGVDLAAGASIGDVERYTVDDTYPWLGGKSTVADKASGAGARRGSWQSRTAPRRGRSPFL